VEKIRKKNYRIVIDVINSTGALFIPPLLKALGVEEVIVLNGEVDGKFAHNPEPLPENLSELSAAVRKNKATWGLPLTRMLTDFALFARMEACSEKSIHLLPLQIMFSESVQATPLVT
jgi:hypothetical protein